MKLDAYSKMVEEKFDAEMAKRFGGQEVADQGVLEARSAVQDLLDKMEQTNFEVRAEVNMRTVMLLYVVREAAEALTVLDSMFPHLNSHKSLLDVVNQAKAAGTCISVLLRAEAAPPSSASSSSST